MCFKPETDRAEYIEELWVKNQNSCYPMPREEFITCVTMTLGGLDEKRITEGKDKVWKILRRLSHYPRKKRDYAT